MPPKIIRATNHEDFVPEVKKRSKPKPYTLPQWIKDYWLERDRLIYKTTKSEETKRQILERYGK